MVVYKEQIILMKNIQRKYKFIYALNRTL